jgi:hypothetical protein
VRKSEGEARKTEDKKRNNEAQTHKPLESCSQEIAEKRPNFVLFFPPCPFFSSGVNHTYALVVLFFVRVMNDFPKK